MYGLPWLSSVNAANGLEASWKLPASYATSGIQLAPPSSDQATIRLWKACLGDVAPGEEAAGVGGQPGGVDPALVGSALDDLDPRRDGAAGGVEHGRRSTRRPQGVEVQQDVLGSPEGLAAVGGDVDPNVLGPVDTV